MHVDEFLYRGRSDTTRSIWHVVLAEQSADVHPVTKAPHPPRLYGPMTPKQAEDMGFPLKAVLADLNAQTLNDLGEARQMVEDLTARIEQIETHLAEARAALVSTGRELELVKTELGNSQMREQQMQNALAEARSTLDERKVASREAVAG